MLLVVGPFHVQIEHSLSVMESEKFGEGIFTLDQTSSVFKSI